MRRTYEILSLVIIAEIIGATYNWRRFHYCTDKRCANSFMHTGCKYDLIWDLRGPGQECRDKKILSRILSESERILILERHNEIRQYVAAGREKRGNPGPQPAAYLMPNLVWDDELAELAQLWANQCIFSEDQCRNVARFRVGQSEISDLYSTKSTLPDIIYIEALIDKWYNQVEKFDKGNVHRYVNSIHPRTKNYVQIIWANTTTIGCGKMKYQKRDYIVLRIVCNYGPNGSIDNEKVYEAIEPENKNVLEKKDSFNTNFTAKPNSNLIVNMTNSSAVINIFIH